MRSPVSLQLFAFLCFCLLVAPTQAQNFGAALAVGDATVFVGEPDTPSASGSVYVFQRDADAWTEAARLTADDAVVSDGFGSALAFDGQTLVVGAAKRNEAQGVAYVFHRDDASGAWMQAGRLAAADGAAGDNFGIDVAVSGDWALAGAYAHDGAGAVYVFHRDASSGVWTQHAKLTGSDVEPGDRFGVVLTLDDHWALISATRHNSARGAVYAFRYDAEADAWTEEAKLAVEDISINSRFGSTLNLRDGFALVGAPRQEGFTGAVYKYQYDEEAQEWQEAGELVAFDGQRQYRFSTALAASDDNVWVSAPGVSGFQGSVYVFQRDAATGEWMSAMKLAPDNLNRGDFFGGSLAMHGDVAVASIPGADYGAGAAAVFGRDPATGAWTQQATLAGQIGGYDAIVGGQVPCDAGEAAAFSCQDVDLVSFLPVRDLGGGRGVRVNDVWGWTDPDTGKEYALVGRVDGMAFVDVSDAFNPVYLGSLPRTEGTPGSVWRDVKTYANHAFIVADGAGPHGVQVFDLTQLRDVADAPVTFEETAHYDQIHSAHNIVINEETGYAYTVGNSSGGETCGGGLHMINVQDPINPTFAGCFADPTTGRASTGYSHDAQCVSYHGPDAEHRGKEICFGANETALSIADVTDKDNPTPLSTGSYPNVGYTHQGWITDDHKYFYVNDELDELQGKVDGTRTLIWDITDLDDPVLVKEYFSKVKSSDHNLYIRGNLMYQSNYVSGLRILDISDPANPVEVGYFDTVPGNDNAPGFDGSWSNYPFFKSGVIVVTSMREGMFLLKKKEVDI